MDFILTLGIRFVMKLFTKRQSLQQVDLEIYNLMPLTNPSKFFLLYPKYQGIFSRFHLLETRHIAWCTLVEIQRAKYIECLQSAELFGHS